MTVFTDVVPGAKNDRAGWSTPTYQVDAMLTTTRGPVGEFLATKSFATRNSENSQLGLDWVQVLRLRRMWFAETAAPMFDGPGS